MNVKKLIEILSSLPQEAEIIIGVDQSDLRHIKESKIFSETISDDSVPRIEISGDPALKDAIVINV